MRLGDIIYSQPEQLVVILKPHDFIYYRACIDVIDAESSNDRTEGISARLIPIGTHPAEIDISIQYLEISHLLDVRSMDGRLKDSGVAPFNKRKYIFSLMVLVAGNEDVVSPVADNPLSLEN